MPLFSYEQFEMFKVIPVAVLINETFITINPSTPILLVNLHRDLHYPMSKSEVSRCMANINSCELAIFTQLETSSCKTTQSTQVPKRIHLSNRNHWIYVLEEKTKIHVVRENTIITEIISGTALINITNGCIIKEDSTILHASNFYPSSMRTSFAPSRNLSNFLELPKLPIAQHTIARTNLEQDIPSLKDALQKLQEDEIKVTISDVRYAHHYSIGSVSLLAMASFLFYFGRSASGDVKRNPPRYLRLDSYPRKLSG